MLAVMNDSAAVVLSTGSRKRLIRLDRTNKLNTLQQTNIRLHDSLTHRFHVPP